MKLKGLAQRVIVDVMFDIEEELKKLPASPGVYLMHNAHDDIIYVGKARILKNRVRQYFQNSRNLTPKIRQMVSHIARFEYIITDSEVEALVLENNLIKEHRPRYNTMLRDDKTYPYIKVTTGEMYPRILLTRRMLKDKAKYFGPFTSSQSVRDTIELLQKTCHIRSCSRALPASIGKERPCLYYHMGQCDAPCQGAVAPELYQEHVAQALSFLGGQYEPVMEMLTAGMNEAAQKLDFEKAAQYRDLLQSVQHISQKQKITSSQADDRDVIAFAGEKNEAVAVVFFVRSGKITGREHFYLTGVENEDPGAVLGSFLKQYYASAPFVPGTLLLQHLPPDAPLIEEWLGKVRERPVHIRVPRRGDKERLVELAAENARMVIAKDMEKIRLEEARTTGAVNTLAGMLDMPAGIRRMEAFDISNISGVMTVGSMVVFENGRPRRNAYRKFRVRSVKGQDDYASMEEVLTRRFSHGLRELSGQEEGASFSDFPDVLMMDGGKGQVNVARRVLDKLGLSIPVCGMVKDDHHRTRGLYYQSRELPIDTHSELFKLITRMQDEAHRFAIEYHRKLRGAGQVKSVLDDIPGIGPARRKALMRYFGDIEKIRTAEIDELKQADAMDSRSALAVYRYFREEKQAEPEGQQTSAEHADSAEQTDTAERTYTTEQRDS